MLNHKKQVRRFNKAVLVINALIVIFKIDFQMAL